MRELPMPYRKSPDALQTLAPRVHLRFQHLRQSLLERMRTRLLIGDGTGGTSKDDYLAAVSGVEVLYVASNLDFT